MTNPASSAEFKKIIFRTLSIISLVYLICIFLFSWKYSDDRPDIASITSDGVGYYMYLPSLFISGTFGDEPADERNIITTQHGSLSRYSVGTAVAIFPFFSVACLYYELSGGSYHGFEPGFHNAVLVAATFYFLLGLYLFSFLLKRFTHSSWTIAWILIALALGSNALIYTIQSPSFSHIYSFCAITGFLLAVRKFIETSRTKYFLIASLLFGFVLLLRQFNGLILFAVPFLAVSWDEFVSFLKTVFSDLILLVSGISCALAVAGIQQLLWFVQTGEFVLWGYGNDGFYFSSPAFAEVLFSFRKGLFIYTPVLILVFLGLIPLFKKNKYRFYSFTAYFLVLTYLISSWWMWYYGSSFGQRPFMEYFGLLFIPLVYLIDFISRLIFKIIWVFCILITAGLNFIQSYQYRNAIIGNADMNFDKYRYVFLRIDADYEGILGGNRDIIPYHKSKKLVFEVSTDFADYNNYVESVLISMDPTDSSNMVSDYRGREYNTLMKVPLQARQETRRALFAEIQLEVLKTGPTDFREDAILVLDLQDSSGTSYYYYPFKIHEIPSNEINAWKQFKYTVELPVSDPSDEMIIYIWNKYSQPLVFDNVELKMYAFPR